MNDLYEWTARITEYLKTHHADGLYGPWLVESAMDAFGWDEQELIEKLVRDNNMEDV